MGLEYGPYSLSWMYRIPWSLHKAERNAIYSARRMWPVFETHTSILYLLFHGFGPHLLGNSTKTHCLIIQNTQINIFNPSHTITLPPDVCFCWTTMYHYMTKNMLGDWWNGWCHLTVPHCTLSHQMFSFHTTMLITKNMLGDQNSVLAPGKNTGPDIGPGHNTRSVLCSTWEVYWPKNMK